MTNSDQLTEEEGRYLLSVARNTIDQKLLLQETGIEPNSFNSKRFFEKRGTFVTLTIDDCLRGCIGNITPKESLIEGVKANAINAAFCDPRFRPLSEPEWEKVKIEVSILTDPKPLDYSDKEDLLEKLRPGTDGVILKKAHNQSTFLPQVWEQLPEKEDFLTHLCLKAGLDDDEWEKGNLEVLTYQVQAFKE